MLESYCKYTRTSYFHMDREQILLLSFYQSLVHLLYLQQSCQVSFFLFLFVAYGPS